MKRVLVTGGAGFIGSHIGDQFVTGGHELHVLDDLSSGARSNVSPRATFHHLDIRSEEARRLIGRLKPDVIVHAAAQISVRKSMADPRFDADVNVVGIVNLLQACDREKPPYFVFLSTGGAMYGTQTVFPAPETHAAVPESIYGLAKRVGEMYLDFWHRTFNLPGVALRLANVYGPRQNPHGEAGVVAIFHERLLSGQGATIYGDGKQTRDFVYVGDVAEAVRRVEAKRFTGILNVGTGVETTVNELYTVIARQLAVSAQATYASGRAGEQARSCIDSKMLGEVCGWRPNTSLEVGLASTVAWYRSQNSK